MAEWPLIQQGDTDSEESNGVFKVQSLLRHRGYDLGADHHFGPITAGKVTEFQSANGLTADGIVGKQTWPRLIVEAAQGASGDAVRAVQSQWRFIDHDGVFGPQTDGLVRDFQQSTNLATDGIVGPQTWQAMGKGPIIDAQ
ncbi:MAG: peptidoglycan-binding domain-containing protein [Acidimicrobiales bacterium]